MVMYSRVSFSVILRREQFPPQNNGKGDSASREYFDRKFEYTETRELSVLKTNGI